MQRLSVFLLRFDAAPRGADRFPDTAPRGADRFSETFASSLNFAFFDFVVNRFRCEEPPFRLFYTWSKILEFSIFIPSVLYRCFGRWPAGREFETVGDFHISVFQFENLNDFPMVSKKGF